MYIGLFRNVTGLPLLVLLQEFLQSCKIDVRQLAQLMTSDLHNFNILQISLTTY